MQIGTGQFTPGPPHVLKGSFNLTRQSGGVLFETSDDFFFDGSPAPGFALFSGVPTDASDPKTIAQAEATDFLRIADKVEPVEGRQAGIIPASIDIDQYDTVVLWCYEIAFILGFGAIERP